MNTTDSCKIYDCFTFFNEIDLLSVRLDYLSSVVDYFVIVEANFTHQGEAKGFIFKENQEKFKDFADKIIYVELSEMPDLSSSLKDDDGNKWLLENYQRDQILKGIKDAKENDIVLISDVDEIPSHQMILSYKNANADEIWVAEMYMMYYFANCLNVREPIWRNGTRIGRMHLLKNPNQFLPPKPYYRYSQSGKPTYFRFCKGQFVSNGGWHFSYCGSAENIKLKLRSIAEQHLDNTASVTEIERRIMKNEDVLGRADYKYIIFKPSKFIHTLLLEHLNKRPTLLFNGSKIFFLWSEVKYFLYRIKMKLIK